MTTYNFIINNYGTNEQPPMNFGSGDGNYGAKPMNQGDFFVNMFMQYFVDSLMQGYQTNSIGSMMAPAYQMNKSIDSDYKVGEANITNDNYKLPQDTYGKQSDTYKK